MDELLAGSGIDVLLQIQIGFFFVFISTNAKKNNIPLQFSVPPAAEMDIKSSSSGYERH